DLRAVEALVVAEVEVGLRAVLGHEHLAVLERRHRAGIDVDVRVQLDVGDADAARFEDRGEGSGGDAFPQRGNYTACYKDILGHLPRACRDGGVYTKKFRTSRAPRDSGTDPAPPDWPAPRDFSAGGRGPRRAPPARRFFRSWSAGCRRPARSWPGRGGWWRYRGPAS